MNENGQLSLIEAESDEALLLSREDAAKRYTARSAEKLEWRRDCILALTGCGLPVDYVASVAHCSARIVRLLGAKYAQAAAQSTQQMSRVLAGLAMKAAFHLDQKLPDAKPNELAVTLGIALQRKQEMDAGGAGAYDPNAEAIDVTEENPALLSARKRLAERTGKIQPPMDADERRLEEVKV